MRPFRQQTTTAPLPKRLQAVAAGELLLPPAPSPSESDRLLVFESIFAGIPLGSLSVWRTSAARDVDPAPGGIRLPAEVDPADGSVHDVVVSGSSWLRVVYEELSPGLAETTPSSKHAERSAIWFDCRTNRFVAAVDQPSAEAFRLSGVLDAAQQHAFQKVLAGRPNGASLGSRLALLVDTIFEYPVPLTRFVLDDESTVERLLPRLGASVPTLAAPSRWLCDDCGTEIQRVEDGWLEWLVTLRGARRAHRLRLVHHVMASPRGGADGCYLTRRDLPRNEINHDNHLDYYLGEDGRVRMFNILLLDRVTPPSFIRMMRRLHERGYEEARYFFERAAEDDAIPSGYPEEVRSTADVAATLEWARTHSLRPQSFWRQTLELAETNDRFWEKAGNTAEPDDDGDE